VSTDREPQPAPQTGGWCPATICLNGRVDPLELIRLAADESGATGIGALLSCRELDRDRRR